MVRRLPHIGLILVQGHRAIWDYDSSLAAAPCNRNWCIAPLVGRCRHTADLDGEAIYVEHFPAGNYVLKLKFGAQDFESRIPVSLKRGVNVVNLTALDIQHNMGYVVGYPHKPSVFHLLWPEPIIC